MFLSVITGPKMQVRDKNVEVFCGHIFFFGFFCVCIVSLWMFVNIHIF